MKAIFASALAAASCVALAGGALANEPAASQKPTTAAANTQAKSWSNKADMENLIGRTVENANGDNVGEIEAVNVDSSGKISSVIVSVGGFLGVGEKDVALAWSDLNVQENGKKVTTAMTKDQLKSVGAYSYRDPAHKGKVFSDR